MEKLEKLRKEALKVCSSRGHKIKPFNRKRPHWWFSECQKCKKKVCVNDELLIRDTGIRGEAFMFDCEDEGD